MYIVDINKHEQHRGRNSLTNNLTQDEDMTKALVIPLFFITF
jgi:hypothetical protein